MLWPGTLPQVSNRRGYAEGERDTVIRSQVGYGPAKLRSRTTAQMYDGSRAFFMTDAQKATLETFYRDNKSVSWEWDEGSGQRSYRFAGPPAYAEIKCDKWSVTMSIEVMP